MRQTAATSVTTAALCIARQAMIEQLTGKTSLTPNTISAIMTAAFGGADASGAWQWRTAYDVMQSAALWVVRAQLRADGQMDPAIGHEIINRVICHLPTQTRRSERQMQLQQFSTALDWSWVAACAADVQPRDVILEPSAGTGCLAGLAAIHDDLAKLILNELDPTRRALLGLGFERPVTAHDAEFIDDLLVSTLIPTVVLMNPPFASSAARGADPSIAIRHVISAAKRLEVGGRLVAIVPPNMSGARQADLWTRLCKLVTPQLRLDLPRTAFRRQGTSVETHMIIAERHDGAGDMDGHCTTLPVASPQSALKVLNAHLPARAQITANNVRPHPAPLNRASSSNADGVKRSALKRFDFMLKRNSLPVPKSTTGFALRDDSNKSQNTVTQKKAFLTPKRVLQNTAEDSITTALVPLGITGLNKPRINEAVSEVYARYKPQRMEITGAQDHPTPLVESLAMASVAPPLPATDMIDLRLPESVVTQGLLSEAQLETLAMAESAFATDLPGRFRLDDEHGLVRDDDGDDTVAYRKGYFLGDGTGCGKGRQVAGAILAGWSAGRHKAVWVSKSATLIEDAKRDWADLGGAPTDIHGLSRWSGDEDIRLQQGILFVTYATLRATSQKGRARLEQVLTWLGDEFDGVIAFDEAHAMQNAGGGESARGVKKPSQQGLAGLRLQNAVPRARVLYVSATGATEVSNLAYAIRLGLWGNGEGYPFASREQFVSAMEAGGVAAMEVVARDLKAMGLYTARALSFEGVEYDVLEHRLSADQITIYRNAP